MKQINIALLLAIFGISTVFGQNIYTTTRGVDIFNAELEKTKQIVESSISHPTGIFVDVNSEKIYWGDSNNFTVLSGNTDGTNVEGLKNRFSLLDFNVFDVYADTLQQKIYFAGYAPSYAEIESGLYSMNMDGSEMKSVYKTGNDFNRAPRAIAPGPNPNTLFITDGNSIRSLSTGQSKSKLTQISLNSSIMGIDYHGSQQKIYALMESELIRMNPDGSELETLADSGFTSGNHVKVDELNQKVYWTSDADYGEREFGHIYEANLDGSEQIAIFESEDISPHGLFINEENGDFYVTLTERFGQPRIQKMRFNEDSYLSTEEIPFSVVNSGATGPEQIVADTKNEWLYWINNASSRNYASKLAQEYFIQRIGFGSNPAKLEVVHSPIRYKERNDAILDLDINEEEEHLYLAIDAPSDFDQLIRFDISTGKADTLVARAPSLSRIQSVSYDASTNSIFYTIYFQNDSTSFRKFDLDEMKSTRIGVVKDAALANNINYSEANQMLYFHHRGESTIYRMNIDNGFTEAVIERNGNGFFDMSENQIYWTDTQETKKSDLDGKNTEAFNNKFGLRDHFVVVDESNTVVSNELITEQPSKVQLNQNYPNPFNPTTTIQFEIPVNSEVSLTLYNMLGQKVSTIYQGRLNSGSHSFRLNAKGISSGVYIYQLKTEQQTLTKRLTLIK